VVDTQRRQSQHILEFYARPSAMTDAGRHTPLFGALPRDVAELSSIVQGLVMHEHIASEYGVALTDEQRSTVHIRPVERMLERLIAADERPLSQARPAGERLVGNCRQFTVLVVSMLRAKGVPARARCGFGGYFVSGSFEDHWVVEYWSDAEARWVLVDVQLDELQQRLFRPDFDPRDVPRDRFLAAGDAWQRCRAGAADPAKFGLSFVNEGGLWWIAGNLVRDVAALNKVEMLPWDDWGAMPGPDEALDDNRLALFDRVAALTLDADVMFAEIRSRYEDDDRLRVPPTVRNAVLNRDEAVWPAPRFVA
jgi:hypothetical protein